jgi:prepilin-type N-terminal cleavage/methylation domain-containing protein
MKTLRTAPPPRFTPDPFRRSSGFTLVEVMIAGAIGSLVLAGVLSSFLMIGRSSQRLFYYNDMEAGSRRILEEFAQDVRMASDSVYNSATSMTLTVPDNYTAYSNQVTYAFGSVTMGSVTYANCFYRRPGNASSGAPPTILVRNVTDCTFSRYDVLGGATLLDSATKRIELSLKVSNTRSTLAAATDKIFSATYLLRNK